MQENKYDLIVIGAGIIGVCAAWYARKRYPEWKIALVDQSKVGSGASYYSASLDIPYGHTPLRYELAKRSRFLYSELRKELPSLLIKDLDFYGITHRDKVMSLIKDITDESAILSPENFLSILQEYPFLALPQDTCMVAGSAAAQAVKNEVANVIAKEFTSSPNSFIKEQTKIAKVLFNEDLYILQTNHGVDFYATRIMQATGPWMTEELMAGFSTPQNVRIKKIVAFHIRQQPKINDQVFYFFDDDAFLMPKYEHGYWLFSFKCDHWDVLPDINQLNIDEADIHKARNILEKYAPRFVNLCNEGRVFCDAYTDDGNPITEKVTGHENYIIAGAGSGSGYRLAPAIAEKAVKMLE